MEKYRNMQIFPSIFHWSKKASANWKIVVLSLNDPEEDGKQFVMFDVTEFNMR